MLVLVSQLLPWGISPSEKGMEGGGGDVKGGQEDGEGGEGHTEDRKCVGGG